MMPKSPTGNAKDVPTTSAELDFSLVLARVIGSIENDPTQLRNVVYELARIKLEREVWQRHPPLSMAEIRQLMLSLDTAINCVESVSLRHDESRALPSLNRLIESSGTHPNHAISNERKPILTFDQPLPAISDTSQVSTLVLSAARVAPRTFAYGFRSRSLQLLAGISVAVFGLAIYLVLQRPFGFFQPADQHIGRGKCACKPTEQFRRGVACNQATNPCLANTRHIRRLCDQRGSAQRIRTAWVSGAGPKGLHVDHD